MSKCMYFLTAESRQESGAGNQAWSHYDHFPSRFSHSIEYRLMVKFAVSTLFMTGDHHMLDLPVEREEMCLSFKTIIWDCHSKK